MQYIYFGTVFAAAVVFLLVGLLLFLQRKNGERSRIILSGMTFLSALNYIGMIICFYIDPIYSPVSIMNIPFLLLGVFVVTIYFIYPVEVVSPGWITWKRLLKMYAPVTGLWLLYRLTLWLGVEYTSYQTIGDMMSDIWSFQVIFRIILILLIVLPTVLLYWLPYTRKYNNTSREWMRGYIVAVMINMLAYLIVNLYDSYFLCSLYICVSISCSLYIVYQELYVRLIRQTINDLPPTIETERKFEEELENDTQQASKLRESSLFERLEKYMNSTKAWRDPDLSAGKIILELYSNRTSLLKAIQQYGYSGYSSYVNSKRVAEFIQIVNQQGGGNYQQIFFDVGFRSKSTALRNFKDITGMIPSEYFKKTN